MATCERFGKLKSGLYCDVTHGKVVQILKRDLACVENDIPVE